MNMVNIDYEWLELPSKGQCYPITSPLRDGKVAVQYLTAMDENIIFSENLYQKDNICTALLQKKVMGNIDVSCLCSGDKEAIIWWLRKTGYGNQYRLSDDTEINLDDIRYKEFNLKGDDNGYFTYITDNGDKITYHLLSFKEEENGISDALKKTEKYIKQNISMNDIQMLFKKNIFEKMLISINGKTNKKSIKQWLEKSTYDELCSFEHFFIKNFPGLETDVENMVVFDDSVFYDII